jgi:hypothetical protein
MIFLRTYPSNTSASPLCFNNPTAFWAAISKF